MEDLGLYINPLSSLDGSMPEAKQRLLKRPRSPSPSLGLPLAVSAHGSEAFLSSIKSAGAHENVKKSFETQRSGTQSPVRLDATLDGVTVKVEPEDRAPSPSQESDQLDGASQDGSMRDEDINREYSPSPPATSSQAYQDALAFVRFAARDASLHAWVLLARHDSRQAENHAEPEVHALMLLARYNDRSQGPGGEALYRKVTRLSEAYFDLCSNISTAARCTSTTNWKHKTDLAWLYTLELSHFYEPLKRWHHLTLLERHEDANAVNVVAARTVEKPRPSTRTAPATGRMRRSAPLEAPSGSAPASAPSMSAQPSTTSAPSPATSRIATTSALPQTQETVITQAELQLQALQIAQLQQHSLQQNQLIQEQMNMLSHLAAEAKRQAHALEQVQQQLATLRLYTS